MSVTLVCQNQLTRIDGAQAEQPDSAYFEPQMTKNGKDYASSGIGLINYHNEDLWVLNHIQTCWQIRPVDQSDGTVHQ